MGVYVSPSVCYLQLAALVDMTYCQLGTHTNSSHNSLRSTSIYTCITYSSLRSFSVQLAALVVYTMILQLASLDLRIYVYYLQLAALVLCTARCARNASTGILVLTGSYYYYKPSTQET